MKILKNDLLVKLILIIEEKIDYNTRSVCDKGRIYILIMFSDDYNKGKLTKIVLNLME